MRNLLVGLALASLLGACGGGTGSGPTLPECAEPLRQFTGPTNLPANFPMPDGVVLIQSRSAGPTTIVDAYAAKELPALFKEWEALLDRPPYSVLKSEQEARDAEVNFAGEETTGQVRLDLRCEGRTAVTITARPL